MIISRRNSKGILVGPQMLLGSQIPCYDQSGVLEVRDIGIVIVLELE